jgi:fumarate reductase subunit D
MSSQQLDPIALIRESLRILPDVYVPLLILGVPALVLSVLGAFLGILALPLTILNNLLVGPVMGSAMILLVDGYVSQRPLASQSALNQAIGRILPIVIGNLMLGLIAFLGALALIIPGVYLGVRLSFTLFGIVLEEKSATGGLAMSWELVKGHWWTVFIPFLLLTLGIGIPVGLLSTALLNLTGEAGSLLVNVFGSLVGTAILPLFVTLGLVLYRTLQQFKRQQSTSTPAA